MKDSLKWGYALNAWKGEMDSFVRHEAQRRALRTLSVLGFEGVELNAGTGRWNNLGRPEVMLFNHGGLEGLRAFFAETGTAVSSMFWDPSAPAEEEGWAFRNVLDPADADASADAAAPFIELLASLGGDQLVMRLAPPAWRTGILDDEQLSTLAALADRVGARAAASGIGVSLHLDCLAGIRTAEQVSTLLSRVEQPGVGLALDTAEFTIAGIDPVAFLREHGDRVTHVHLKDTRFTDTGEEFLMPGAETAMLRGGDGRRIERWFFPLGTEGGLVDVPAVVGLLRERRYDGWVVVESDGGDDPAELAMQNSWYVQRELGAALR